MFELLYPDEYLESTYKINFEHLYQEGYRGVLFDIDNTLVPHGAPADRRAIRLFHRLKEIGFQTCLISNNKEPRVKSFSDQVGSEYIYKAGKPLPGGYLKGMEKMKTTTESTLFVGDQIFTDVLGARRAGLYTIMVEPIHPKEEIQIVLKRYLEKVVLFFYFRSRKKKRVEK
ncbi:MAG: YqeG family HAD IIIA-type phosphatase [Clostridiales bacterium]|nr:YqeG family HAD IIIA-type phosphatase [Clostridiales bacterium]